MTLRKSSSQRTFAGLAADRFVAAGCMVAVTLGGMVGVNVLGSQAASAATTQASVAPCTARSVSTPFVRWGDSAKYFLSLPMEISVASADWNLSAGAAVVSGGEPYGVVAEMRTVS